MLRKIDCQAVECDHNHPGKGSPNCHGTGPHYAGSGAAGHALSKAYRAGWRRILIDGVETDLCPPCYKHYLRFVGPTPEPIMPPIMA